MMKILKGIIIGSVCLIVIALGIMLYAENANYTFDKEEAAAYVTEHAEAKSRTWCAWYVMRALQEGGCPIYLLPAYGYSWLLPKMDFVEVSKENYIPQKGDLIVFPAIGKHIWGHIQMWNGKQWVSDFRQKNMIPAKAYHKTKWQIFRYKGKK